MKRDNWLVTSSSIRPASKPTECFYCKQPLGVEHLLDCVIRRRTVVVQMTLKFVRVVPESWSNEDIEFQLNESSWCSNNILDDLEEIIKAKGCICSLGGFDFVREATVEDENWCGIFVNLLKD